MLTSIVLSNFRSFKNKTEIDFKKTNYTILPQNVADNGVLKGAIFVGANGSGKSNILLAIKILLDLLFKERSIDYGLLRCLFGTHPSFSIEYHFFVNGCNVKYFLNIDPLNTFINEKLYCDNRIMLERMGKSATSYIADAKGIMYGDSDVAGDSLFLRTLYFNTKFSSNTTLSNWMSYLEKSIYVNLFEHIIMSYGKEKMGFNAYLKREGCGKVNGFLNQIAYGQTIEYGHEAIGSRNHFSVISEDEEDRTVFFRREGLEEPVPFSEESSGNQSLLRFLPSFFSVMSNGGMLLVDEFSSSFHNELEELLVKFFMLKCKYSQMFFVSHSTNLLSNSILRPDQEYAVAFDNTEGSEVLRFSSQQPRNAQNIEKMYNSGIFGGLPYYKDNFYED